MVDAVKAVKDTRYIVFADPDSRIGNINPKMVLLFMDRDGDALAFRGEFPGVAVVITDGEVRVNGSMCTLRARRIADIKN